MHVATRRVVAFVFVCAVLLTGLSQSHAAGPYSLLHGFTGGPNDGANPQFNANLATDGTSFYGVTLNGGITNRGVLFKLNVNGSGYQVLHKFNGLGFIDMLLGGTGNTNDGVNPEGTPLLIGSTLYGTTTQGGTNGLGTAYKINTDGNGFQLLHSFGVNTLTGDGSRPQCSLVTDGTFLYGMTISGSGANNDLGTIFKMDTNGANYSILHVFGVQTNNGNSPEGSLIISGSTLYGMTQMGGTLSSGTLFAIGTDGGGFHVIHNFTGVITDGASPYGSPILIGNTLYGMTSNGGTNNVGCVFSVDVSGANFKFLHSFSISTTWQPFGDLTLANNGLLYGMTSIGGSNGLGFGTIFQVDTNDGSSFQILHTFFFAVPSNTTDGNRPFASLAAVGSNLYGMTDMGGSTNNAGAIFSFTPTGGGGGGGSPAAGIKVNILPSAAVKAGAQWQLNGGSLMNSGTLVGNAGGGAHVISYKAVTGWIAPAPLIIDLTVGITNTVTATYTAADTTKPVLKVLSPTTKTIVAANPFTATGTATDNVGVALVFYQLNGGDWIAAATQNNWTNWTTVNLTLTPGVNTMKFYAKDLSGNVSPTNSVNFTFVVTSLLTVTLNPPNGGTIKPNLNGQLLQIGKPYSLSVKATKGFSFLNWSGGTNTSSPKITFIMVSNLTFTANFKDNTRPVNVILTPTKNQAVSNAAPVATGRAMDNVGVAAVSYQVNGGAWTPADVTDGTNWHTATLTLSSGANTISAYAVDAAGNISLTNTIAFTYETPPTTDWAPDSLNGLLASVTPDNGSPVTVGFGASTFGQTSTTGSTDPQDYGGGTYTYLKMDTNHAQLSLAITMPPTGSNNVGPVDLIFTNHNAGTFTNETSGDTGTISLSSVSSLVPASLQGKTLTAVSTSGGKTVKIKLSATTFTKTPANNSNTGSSSGSYTFAKLSGVGGILSFNFTGAEAGQKAYVQLSFTTATSGTYFALVYDSLGVLQDADAGHFNL